MSQDEGAGGGAPEHGPEPASDPNWAGWRHWRGDHFEDHAGPFYFREEEGGSVRCGFRVGAQHINGQGSLHGGAMLTFADYALFVLAQMYAAGGAGVTVSLNGEFVGPAHLGELVEATGEVVRAGGSLIFMRGLISTGGRAVMTFSGVLKRVRR